MAAQFVETSMEDMSSTWDDTIDGDPVLPALRLVLARDRLQAPRAGRGAKDPRDRSKYSDGLIGWDKIPIALPGHPAPLALQRVRLRVQAMVQMAPPDYRSHPARSSKSLLFRFGAAKNNPEGTLAAARLLPALVLQEALRGARVHRRRARPGRPADGQGADGVPAGQARHRAVQDGRGHEEDGPLRAAQRAGGHRLPDCPTTRRPSSRSSSFELLTSGGARQHTSTRSSSATSSAS